MPYLTISFALLRDAIFPTCWLIRFLYSLLLRFARWSSFDGRLNWCHTTRSPHILSIDWWYDWLIACLVCRDMVTWVNIQLSILSIEKYASDCMNTRYATYIPLPIICIVLWPSQQWNYANNFLLQTGSILPNKLTTYWLPIFPYATSLEPWHKYLILLSKSSLCSLKT